ncbi:MAG: AAA family ATPase [Phycisphaerae bacterium]|jgi:type II secretory pathway predicted ATPase ExeA
MKPYRHFGLVRPPFEPSPDPRMFYSSPQHGEALATLEYTVHANKTCTVVVGESGSGKTMLARLIAAEISRETSVLWVHGLGQPEKVTELNVYSPGALADAQPKPPTSLTTLADWTRQPHVTGTPPLMVIDDADDMPPHAWHDVVSLLSREVQFPQPTNLALFGAPPLIARLGQPELMRLRRRVFRTCAIGPFDAEQVAEYVRCRLAASGNKDNGLFDDDSLALLHRLTKGNAGLINQVADNALLEAFSANERRITVRHIMAAGRAIVGALHVLPRRPSVGLALGDGGRRALPGAAPAPAEAASAWTAGEPESAVAERPVITTPKPVAPDIRSVEQRLFSLQGRLANALGAVRPSRASVRPRYTAPVAKPVVGEIVDVSPSEVMDDDEAVEEAAVASS